MPKKHRMQKIALLVTRLVGSPVSIAVHTIIFAAAIYVLVRGVYPFDVVILVLNTAVSLEAIYLALFIQMTVNYQQESLEEVEADIDEIQEDIDEIQEDVDEIQEDVEEMSEEDKADEVRELADARTLSEIKENLRALADVIERLQK